MSSITLFAANFSKHVAHCIGVLSYGIKFLKWSITYNCCLTNFFLFLAMLAPLTLLALTFYWDVPACETPFLVKLVAVRYHTPELTAGALSGVMRSDQLSFLVSFALLFRVACGDRMLSLFQNYHHSVIECRFEGFLWM